MERQLRFCATPAGARIAYATLGAGPPLVFPAWWFNHLDVLWELPSARSFFERLAQHHTVVVFDNLGCGLSDRARTTFSLDADLQVLETVVEQLDAAPIALFGFSQGGPVAIAYAVAHPDRVSHLVLFGTTAHSVPRGDPAKAAELWAAIRSLMLASWGLGSSILTQVLMPGADAVTSAWMTRYQLESVEAEMAIAILEQFQTFDVTALLPRVRVPTLVMHRRDEQANPFQQGRELAAAIPGARFVPLEGAWHTVFTGDVETVVQRTAAFLGDPPDRANSEQAPAWHLPLPAEPYVFLSYASVDCDRAVAVLQTLEQAGITVWLDRRSIAGGTSWDTEIVRAIDRCAALVVLCTEAALQSPNVRQELRLAWEQQRPLLPLTLEPVRYPEEVRYVLAGRQWVELLQYPEEQWLPQVLAALAGFGLTPAAAPAAPPGEAPPPTPLAPEPQVQETSPLRRLRSWVHRGQ